MTPDVESLQYPNAYRVDSLAGCALSISPGCKDVGHTFVVIFLAVEITLKLIRATVLGLDLVVERSDVGRNVSSCNCGRSYDEHTKGGGREMHAVLSRGDKDVVEKQVRSGHLE